MKFYFRVPKLPVAVSFTIAVLIIGAFGIGGLGGLWPASRAWINWRKMTVFAAAPTSSTRTGPENLKSVNWKLPPPYLNIAPLNTQRTQSLPSTPKAPPGTDNPKFSRWEDIGGTVGAPPPPTISGASDGACGGGTCGGACASVDVWLLESTKNVAATPNANDTNAVVVLYITPPEVSGGIVRYGYTTSVSPRTGQEKFGGARRNRTADNGFADHCLTTWRPRHRTGKVISCQSSVFS
jgi:hypothetical protein